MYWMGQYKISDHEMKRERDALGKGVTQMKGWTGGGVYPWGNRFRVLHSKKPCVHVKEPCIHSNEPYLHANVPHIHVKELCSTHTSPVEYIDAFISVGRQLMYKSYVLHYTASCVRVCVCVCACVFVCVCVADVFHRALVLTWASFVNIVR